MSRARWHAAFGGLALALILILPRPAHATPGDVDPSFGRHGASILTFGAAFAQGSAIAIDDHGRIVVAGTSGASATSANAVAVARLDSDGVLDESFSRDGMATVPLPAKSEVGGMAIDAAHRLVIAATSGGDLFALRMSVDGELDPTFGAGGIATLPAGVPRAAARSRSLRTAR